MKITHNKIGQNLNVNDQLKSDSSKQKSSIDSLSENSKMKQAEDVKSLTSSKSADAVQLDLSDRSKDIRQAKEIALASPDIDMEKVEKFRKLIDEGKYKVDAKAVADRMVNDGLLALGQTNNE
jgi:negative regulator of flagellin synthesis FlgM